MSSIYFNPWIGSKYGHRSCFGCSVLVLGEAHYGSLGDRTSTEFTTEIVNWLGQEDRNAFFTKIAKMLLGKDGKAWLDNETRADLYENIAFYNYVQCFVSGPRVAPTQEQWRISHPAFPEVLSLLKPEVIVVLGDRLDQHMVPVPPEIKSCVVMHPSSSRFSYREWNLEFKNCVQAALSGRIV